MTLFFPDFLEPYRQAARELIKHDAITHIVFSGPTYQIAFADPSMKEPVWVFLQLDPHNHVQDLFCSCSTSTHRGSCVHMAAAHCAVFRGTQKTLHEQYAHSVWHYLLYALWKEKSAKTREIFVEISGADKEKVLTILSRETEETEENSIKFSNLSEEELEAWRQRRPSDALQYELSPLSDFAKWCFLQEGPAVITFKEHKGLPQTASIKLGKLAFVVTLSEKILEAIIPTLAQVTTNLPCIDQEEANISSIEYQPQENALVIHRKKSAPPNGITIGNWIYVPHTAFIAARPKTDQKEVIHDPELLSAFFTERLSLLKKHLTQYSFIDTPQEVQYTLFFEKEELHIVAPSLEKSVLFGEWAYNESHGFVRSEPLLFSTPQYVVQKESIDSFLAQHRNFLGTHSGFAVHTMPFEEDVDYTVDSNGTLQFFLKKTRVKIAQNPIDLGEWVFVPNDGFYPKRKGGAPSLLPLDRAIASYMVPEVIRRHAEYVQSIPNFFAQECPISNIWLKIEFKKSKEVEIQPCYMWTDPQDEKEALFFEEYVFVPKKGFYILPPHLRPLHFMRTISQRNETEWNAFFQELLPRLRSEYRCEIDPKLEKIQELALTLKPLEKQEVPFRWDVDLYWQAKKEKIPIEELIRASQRHERFVPTDAGVVDLEEERFSWLHRIQKKKHRQKEGYQLSSQDFILLSAYDSLHVDSDAVKKERSFTDFLQKLLHGETPEPPNYTTLACTLRPYQENGVQWLWFLYHNGLSGLLCDDMGVGKTHQAMALMAAVKGYQKEKKSLFAVVCPTSLIFHWQDKLQKFLPQFRIKVYGGTLRTLDDFPGSYDVLLTSYGIWRNDAKKLKSFVFDVAFFDELQIAKNHISRIHAALLQMTSRMKVGLTGTPIENNLRELKALFDIVLPGYMPESEEYREFFVRAIEKGDSVKRKNLLARYIKPFVLRRRKADVLADLPAKSEEIYYAELLGEQKGLYRHVASMQAAPLLHQLKDSSSPIPYMHIFALLSSLKQICNHPAAYLRDVANYERYESGKWEAFIELLEEAIESEQKVVVFSQYLAMLDIIEAFLQKNHIQYAAIRGETKNRGAEVFRFQQEPQCRVFVGSLQAAGLGIDLTAASVVIHYDRWWNAARENQATDRVHRIGQVRGVQVFKLLTKQTIEERIDRMIEKKSGLLEDILSFDDQHLIKKLTREEIISLLEEVMPA